VSDNVKDFRNQVKTIHKAADVPAPLTDLKSKEIISDKGQFLAPSFAKYFRNQVIHTDAVILSS